MSYIDQVFWNIVKQTLLRLLILTLVTFSHSCPPSCPPGTRCSSENDNYCIRCKPGTYQDGETNSTLCIDCRPTCGQKEVMIKNCTSLSDTVCQCIEGYHPNFEATCVPHSKCPPGQGVKTAGTSAHDTVCVACEEGSFSAVTSSTEPCVPCTKCLEGENAHRECSAISDRNCTVIECGPVANPENGWVNIPSGTAYSKIASFGCNDGYYLSGSPTITCESLGNWSNIIPKCVAMPYDNCEEWKTATICVSVCLVGYVVVLVLALVLYSKKHKSSYRLSRDKDENNREQRSNHQQNNDVKATDEEGQQGRNSTIPTPEDQSTPMNCQGEKGAACRVDTENKNPVNQKEKQTDRQQSFTDSDKAQQESLPDFKSIRQKNK